MAKSTSDESLPSISIIIPTYNSEATLFRCLESIAIQDYPKTKVEVIVVDGGSKDKTLEVADKYGISQKLYNPLRTGEAGKAVGVQAADYEIIALVDSDNILQGTNWLREMVAPFRNPKIVGAEPLFYTYRMKDPLISRYCALLGMNDPLCLYLGNYDRYSYVSERWTEAAVKTVDMNDYILVELVDEKNLPTIGANGFLIRTELVRKLDYRPYLFDIDIIYQLAKEKKNTFAKVKIGIIHLFAGSTNDFIKKTYRRIRDYTYYKRKSMRKYPWNKADKLKLLRFIFYTVLLFPSFKDSIKGYRNMPDKAWFYHPLACQLTLLTYSIVLILVNL
jgi:glycosyltransferase involved in cell wall biosynthesis